MYPADTKPVDISLSEAKVPPQTVVIENREKTKENTKERESEVNWDPPVPLNHLTPSHQQQVRQLLRKECNAFAKDEHDVGTIPSLQLKIRLNDPTPVRRTYI